MGDTPHRVEKVSPITGSYCSNGDRFVHTHPTIRTPPTLLPLPAVFDHVTNRFTMLKQKDRD
jgi:hypothetical protein